MTLISIPCDMTFHKHLTTPSKSLSGRKRRNISGDFDFFIPIQELSICTFVKDYMEGEGKGRMGAGGKTDLILKEEAG